METLTIPQTTKFRWLCDADDRRNSIAKKIKSLLKLDYIPTLPIKLSGSYGTDFYFELPTGECYRFVYCGCDTAKGGIYKLITLA